MNPSYFLMHFAEKIEISIFFPPWSLDGEVDDFKRSFKALRWLLSAREDLEDLEDRRDATEPKSSTSTLGRKISASLEKKR